MVVVEPFIYMPLVERFAPDGPILQKEIVLLSLPLAVFASVLKKILPPLVVTAALNAPFMVQLVITLLVAPPINLMVDVPDVAEAVVFSKVRELLPVFKPLNVTLSAPFKSINGEPAAIAPEIVLAAPPVGCMLIAAYNAPPEPLAFSKAGAVSVVLPVRVMAMVPWWVPRLMASNAPFKVEKLPDAVPADAVKDT